MSFPLPPPATPARCSHLRHRPHTPPASPYLHTHRWATAALVPSTVASAVAVACRWGASAQAFRMRGGIPGLADMLLGAHGLACCRPVVNAIRALVANDPPSLREIR